MHSVLSYPAKKQLPRTFNVQCELLGRILMDKRLPEFTWQSTLRTREHARVGNELEGETASITYARFFLPDGHKLRCALCRDVVYPDHLHTRYLPGYFRHFLKDSIYLQLGWVKAKAKHERLSETICFTDHVEAENIHFQGSGLNNSSIGLRQSITKLVLAYLVSARGKRA